jgi:uncharacterized protein with HEPN domain
MPSRGERRERTAFERVEDMLDAIARIQDYTKDMDLTAFLESRIAIDAVVRNFEIVGEAARHVPARLHIHYTAAPWRRIVGMRNRLAHDYPHTDVPLVWETIRNDLPTLEIALRAMLAELRGDDTL